MFRRLLNSQLWLGLQALKSCAGRTLTSVVANASALHIRYSSDRATAAKAFKWPPIRNFRQYLTHQTPLIQGSQAEIDHAGLK